MARSLGSNGKRAFAAGLCAALLLLGGCGGLSDSLNPAGWFSSSDSEEPATGDAKADEAKSEIPAGPPAPDWDALREKMADGLPADRENARYSDEPIPRQSEQLDAPPRAATGNAR